MDDKKRSDEEQVEDLEVEAHDAEEVKGGFSWGESQTADDGSTAGSAEPLPNKPFRRLKTRPPA